MMLLNSSWYILIHQYAAIAWLSGLNCSPTPPVKPGPSSQVDATDEDNKALATKFGVQGFPTLKVSLHSPFLSHR